MTNNKLRSLGLVLAAVVGLSFATIAAVLLAAVVYAHECPPEGCFADGRMTGGGRLEEDMIVTHGFELHCNIEELPNNLEVNWDGGNHFHLDELTRVDCIDDPNINPRPPRAGFDLMEGGGIGTYNGEEGATIYFVLTDAGEPGSQDTARLLIRDADDNIVLDVQANLDQGNQQAHNVNDQ
ncbi:MAG TPA: hypothetical protein VLA68_01695 [Nitrososphaera sp.]|nr:hypothetical protein [Nitrososphaera sp.]